MKHLILIVAILLSQSVISQEIYYVTADNGLYAREAPDKGSKAITKLNYGTAVEILENTNLKMDVKDAGEKVSGEWVKIRTEINYNVFDAYVFNAYLTDKKLEPRTKIPFEHFDVEIQGVNLYKPDPTDRAIIRDTAIYYVELGEMPLEKIVKIKPTKHYKKIEVYSAHRNSITVQNEGPHCDLTDWNYYQSAWKPLIAQGDNKFYISDISQQERTVFPKIDAEELKKKVLSHCGEDYAYLLKQVPLNNNTAIMVGLSHVYLKVVMTDLNNNRIEKIVAIEIPMGC